MIESSSVTSRNKQVIFGTVLLLIWVFAPSLYILTDVTYSFVALTWVFGYHYLWASFSLEINPNLFLGTFFHLPTLLFMIYVVFSIGKQQGLKRIIASGLLAELPFIIGSVYYLFFPPGVYGYYIAIPIPLVVVLGILISVRNSFDSGEESNIEIGQAV